LFIYIRYIIEVWLHYFLYIFDFRFRDQVQVKNPKKLTDEELARFLEIDDNPTEPLESEIDNEEDFDLEEEVINESEHDSSSELSGEEQVENDDESEQENRFYVGRDKTTKWRKTSIAARTAKTMACNIIKILPGPKKLSRVIDSEVDAFLQIFSVDIFEEILRCTNVYIDSIKEKFQRDRDAKYVSMNELQAFLGLLILSGVKKAGHTSFLELWNTDGSGIEVFRACMSSKRFLFLLRTIRFDDVHTRTQRRETDKLAPIRFVLDKFIDNCKNAYRLSEFVTIGEMLVPFRGRCGFIQYIPNKPAKYGLKIFALCDAKTFYTSNIEVYCGKQPQGLFFKQFTFRCCKKVN